MTVKDHCDKLINCVKTPHLRFLWKDHPYLLLKSARDYLIAELEKKEFDFNFELGNNDCTVDPTDENMYSYAILNIGQRKTRSIKQLGINDEIDEQQLKELSGRGHVPHSFIRMIPPT